MHNESNPFDGRVHIRPYGAEDASRLEVAAAADNHGVAAPSHVICRGREIIGYLSIGTVPSVYMWLDSKAMHARDTVDVVNFYENYIAGSGASGFFLPVPDASPLRPFVEKLGYNLVAKTTLFFKSFKKGGQ